MKQVDKIALQDWEKFKEDIARSTPVDKTMTHAERENTAYTSRLILSNGSSSFARLM